MNAFLNLKTADKALQFRPSKSKSMLGKTNVMNTNLKETTREN